jgi:hypothetical protein
MSQPETVVDLTQTCPTETATALPLTAFTNIRDYLRDVPMQLCVIRGLPRLLIDVNVIGYLRDALFTLGDRELRNKISRKHVTGFSTLFVSTGVTEHYNDCRNNFIKIPRERAPPQNYCVDLPRGEISEPTIKLIQKQLVCLHKRSCKCGPSREFAQFPWLEMKYISGAQEDLNTVREMIERRFISLNCEYDPVTRTYTQRILAPWDPMFVSVFGPLNSLTTTVTHQVEPRFDDLSFMNHP